MNLSEVPLGRKVRIDLIEDEMARAHLLRLGLVEGAVVECVQRIPMGPVILRKATLELALGHGIAKIIRVSPEEDED